MSVAVIISMIVSYFVGTTPELLELFFTGITKWLVIFAPLLAILAISAVLANDPSKLVAQLCLYGFAGLMGLSFATIFAIFTMGSIVSAFMGAAICSDPSHFLDLHLHLPYKAEKLFLEIPKPHVECLLLAALHLAVRWWLRPEKV